MIRGFYATNGRDDGITTYVGIYIYVISEHSDDFFIKGGVILWYS
jgi:hypothetical protein